MSEIMIYTTKDLNQEEKDKFFLAEKTLNQILKNEILDDYLEENVQGKVTRELHKEAIKPFLAYLKERADFVKCDYILSCVERRK